MVPRWLTTIGFSVGLTGTAPAAGDEPFCEIVRPADRRPPREAIGAWLPPYTRMLFAGDSLRRGEKKLRGIWGD